MSDKHQKDGEMRNALRALLSDIEGMYEGAEDSHERGAEEFFGPFSVGRLEGVEIADISISWPNLAISMRNARNALRDSEKADASA